LFYISLLYLTKHNLTESIPTSSGVSPVYPKMPPVTPSHGELSRVARMAPSYPWLVKVPPIYPEILELPGDTPRCPELLNLTEPHIN
jgi:hypothetical protein